MCVACNAPFWLTPRRSAADELTFQSARLGAGDAECERCADLEAEIEELQRELREIEEYYKDDE